MATIDAQVRAGDGALDRLRASLARPGETYVRAGLAALSGTAAVLHFAFMSPHFSEYWLYGVFFALVAWLQLVWAAAIVSRPSRLVAAAGIANVAIIAVWVSSRTVGVFVGPHASVTEAATFPNVLAVVLEGLIVVGSVSLLIGRASVRRAVGRPLFAGASVAVLTVALAVGATVAVTPRYASAHSHAVGAGHTHGGGGGGGHVHATTTVLTGNSPCEKSGPAASPGQVTDSTGHFHRGPALQEPIDEATRLQLQSQQEIARTVAATYPTVADAKRAGYRMSTPYVPCIGAHYTNTRYAVAFDVAHPSELLYDGINPNARIVGLSYLVWHPGGPPVGFAGPNDRWHQHNLNGGLCMRGEVVVGAEQTTKAECAARGGVKVSLNDIWMVHDWVVPGFECSWGVFASECPELGGRTGGTAWDAPDPGGRPIPQG